ncbi:HEPN domain-containing protein [uncultured Fusobacterium sp.]|uniref:HEPN domain-containing protein n=1 Tax=uncultured Fusobacterium sp. TaxID=159267 RepID=UPI00265FA5B6|nr:HEPN domain-containing protein [uncultured Fusobacterium sp.]
MDSIIHRILSYTDKVQQEGYEFLTRYDDPYNPIEIWVKKDKYEKEAKKLLQKINLLSKKIFDEELKNIIVGYHYKSVKIFERKIKNTNDIKEKEKLEKILQERKEAEENFEEYINKKYPVKFFRVFSNINGVFTEDKIQLGNFKVYNFKKNKKKIEKSFFKKPSENFWSIKNYNYILETLVEARDQEMAYILANEKNETFLDLLALISIIENQYYNCSIGAIQEVGTIKMNAATDKTLFSFEDFLLEKNFVLDLKMIKKNKIFKRLIKIMSRKNLNEFEDKILVAIGWIRDSLVEEKNSSALLKAMISLETLFCFDDGSKPGITHIISESVLLILGKNLQQRLEIEKQVKKLYGKRSSVTHSGKARIEKEDCDNLRKIAVNVIIEFLLSKKYRNITKIDELNKYLKNIKYR